MLKHAKQFIEEIEASCPKLNYASAMLKNYEADQSFDIEDLDQHFYVSFPDYQNPQNAT